MILEFLPGALDTYKSLKGSNPSLASKATILDALEHPTIGIGEPVQLTVPYRTPFLKPLL